MSRFWSSFWDVWSRLWRLPPDPFDPEDWRGLSAEYESSLDDTWLRGQEIYRKNRA